MSVREVAGMATPEELRVDPQKHIGSIVIGDSKKR